MYRAGSPALIRYRKLLLAKRSASSVQNPKMAANLTHVLFIAVSHHSRARTRNTAPPVIPSALERPCVSYLLPEMTFITAVLDPTPRRRGVMTGTANLAIRLRNEPMSNLLRIVVVTHDFIRVIDGLKRRKTRLERLRHHKLSQLLVLQQEVVEVLGLIGIESNNLIAVIDRDQVCAVGCRVRCVVERELTVLQLEVTVASRLCHVHELPDNHSGIVDAERYSLKSIRQINLFIDPAA